METTTTTTTTTNTTTNTNMQSSNSNMETPNDSLAISHTALTFDDDEGLYDTICGFLFPKIAPIRWTTFLILTILIGLPTAGFIMTFTKMGFGKQVLFFFSNHFETVTAPLAISLAAFSFILYLFDIQHWSSEASNWLRNTCYSILIIGACIVTLLGSDNHPYGPIVVFVIALPFYLAGVRCVFYSHKESREYIYWLSGPLFVVAIITTALWLVWTFIDIDNEWNLGIALNEAEDSGCVPDYSEYPDCEGDDGGTCFNFDADLNAFDFDDCDDGETCQIVFEDCYNPFILWVGPFLASLGLLFLSFYASFLRGDGSPEQEARKFASVWMFILFGMWVTASLAGAGAGVSTTLMALTLASFVAAAVFINIAFNSEERKEKMSAVVDHLMDKYGGYLDLFRGLLVVTCTPVFMCYLFISFLIQKIRSITFTVYSKPDLNTNSLRNITGQGYFTIEGRRIIRMIQSWDTTKVFTYAIYWGLAFMIMNVIVSQYTLVFLSWLIETTSQMDLIVVTFILVGVGMTMFLLPPVPGVPIYLTLGIVIIPVGRQVMGVTWSITYAMVVSLALKLLACTLQQTLIGGLLKSSVAVRQFVGVNSNIIRAMKLVLRKPGLGIAKVCILVGGPDWPTSVLCGIMGLPLLPILVGTLPIIFLIFPTLLTGSFTYMADVRDENGENEFAWAGTLATVFTAITALVQFGSMVVAAYYLEKVMVEKKDELELIPIDEEVKRADELDEELNKAYSEVSQWDELPTLARFILCLSLSCMIFCCYLVQLFASSCFTDYQLTYSIDTHLDGDWRNLVKPLGVVANSLLLASVVFLQLFVCWANRKASQLCASKGAIIPENGETNYAPHGSRDSEDPPSNELKGKA